jgi:putative peptide maturation dehydrogenase
MRLRRCSILFLEPREETAFDLDVLLDGGDGLARTRRWIALAPHVAGEVEVDATERELLGELSPQQWVESRRLAEALQPALKRLLKLGLVIGSTKAHAPHRVRDERLRDTHWHPLAATLHVFTRWNGADAVKNMQDSGTETAVSMRKVLGAPPIEAASRREGANRLSLPRSAKTQFDTLLARRATCRNFDPARPLPQTLFAQLLERVFAAQERVRVTDDTVVLKKNSPSGGGLHPVEAYLVVQNVEGVAPGLYHYPALDHALEPLAWPEALVAAKGMHVEEASSADAAYARTFATKASASSKLAFAESDAGVDAGMVAADAAPTDEAGVAPDALRNFVMHAVAQQHWFADAHVVVVLAPRFARTFWKYRRHAKAYRVIALEAGHLSQNLYLSATEVGLGAFITGAINEVFLEQAFDLDPICEGALAVCGFGWRGEEMVTTEFDPACAVWRES